MKILAIAWKDTLLRFADKGELVFFFILPVVFIFLLGGTDFGSDEVDIAVLVVDEDQTAFSTSLQQTLQSSSEVRLLAAERAEAQLKFEDGDAAAWLMIPAGFQASLLAGEPARLELHKQPNNSAADAAAQAVQAAASAAGLPLEAARFAVEEAGRLRPFANAAERQAYFEASLDAARQRTISPVERILVTRPPQADTGYNQGSQTLLGQIITWVFIPLVGTSGLLAYERRGKTLLRLLTTPTSRAIFLGGTVFGQLLIALVQMALLVAFGVYILHINLGSSPLGLWLLLVTFGLASLALGVALGTFIHSEKQASNLSVMIGMVFALLGGCWWPLELFPPAMQTAARILPTTWAMQGLTDLSMRGLGLEAVLPAAGVLLVFAVVFFGVGVARFRYE